MNKDKMFITVYSAICMSKGFAESEMSYEQVVSVANCVVEKLFEAELILHDKHTGAITESANLANTVLGEVCPHCRKLITTEFPVAGSSETGDVALP